MAKNQAIFSRRNMLIGVVGGAAATAGAVATRGFSDSASFANLFRPAGGQRGTALAMASSADWEAHVGSFFTANTGHVLKLVDVQPFAQRQARPAGLREDAFVARFDVAKGGVLPGSQIYRFSHTEGGDVDLFMTGADPRKPLRMLAVLG